MLLDRRRECRVLDQVLVDIRRGESRALVLRGEAGIGKSVLLEYVVDQASGCQIMRVAGVEAEQELAFAALHQVCAPMMNRLHRLPEPQQAALGTVFGLSAGGPPDPFMVGLAVLGLFGEAAQKRPLLCVIDDAQWLDRASAQVLAFAARRLLAESVAMIFAVREAQPAGLAGLDELTISGLPDEDARALLTLTHPGPVDDRVVERIIGESRGNPLALVELPRGFTPMEFAGGFGLRDVAVPRRIEESFRRQIGALPPATRQLLLVAAAETVGDPVLVLRAADRLGIAIGAPPPDLVTFTKRVRFRHPLLRTVVYLAASTAERRGVHRALAAVTDAMADPDRRAWHLAHAAAGPDEGVAAELDRCAGRARARGGVAAAASFYMRAAELTPDPRRRGQRALTAAQAKHQAGMPKAALRLLSLADASPLGEFQRAEADLLRARIAFTVDRGRDAPALLLKAARRLESLDRRLARDTYLEALRAAWFVAQLADTTGLGEVAEVAIAAPPSKTPLDPTDLLLHGLTARYASGYAAGAPRLRQALRALHDPDVSADEELELLWFANTIAMDLMQEKDCGPLSSRYLQLSWDSGSLATVPMALTIRIVVLAFLGELSAADSLLEQLHAIIEGTEIHDLPYAAQLVAAWQGAEDRAAELIAVTTRASWRRGEGVGLLAAAWMQALLYNGLGRYAEALVAAQQATLPRQEMGLLTWTALVELITAAARTDQIDTATDALGRLAELTQASGTDWALGLEAGCRGLVSDDAEPHYREAIARLSRAGIRSHLARIRLHYGEWLRRQNRRVDARNQLRAAHTAFTTMGMDGFAERAAGELAATGETVRKRRVETASNLTAQEAQIARLVRDGLTNPEIAARLFISRRTVEWHLSKIFGKLQITSRRQLRH